MTEQLAAVPYKTIIQRCGASDILVRIRIRICITDCFFNSGWPDTHKNKFFQIILAYYFLEVLHLYQSSKKKRSKRKKKSKNSRNQGFFFLFLLVDERIWILEAPKYTDPDPQHCWIIREIFAKRTVEGIYWKRPRFLLSSYLAPTTPFPTVMWHFHISLFAFLLSV